ncbi:MAG: hypothetical protein AABW46_01545 [Nanoarchaeota archaeon]
MNLDKIKESLQGLTPQQKLELLNKNLKNEKSEKGREQILLFIEEAKQEQLNIEANLKSLQVRTIERTREEQLENIVEEEQLAQTEQKRGEEIQQLYGTKAQQNKTTGLYMRETQFYAENRSNRDYKPQESDRFTIEREQNLINPQKSLEKERRKYETGRED